MNSSIQLGDIFREKFTVTEKVYHDFIRAFGDKNPLHSDPAFASKYGFSQVVMHGNILNGFISFFAGMCLPLKNIMIYSQQLDFKKPVYLQDKLTLEAEVTGVFESVNLIEFRIKFIKEEGTIVAKGKLQIGILK